jgi:hypothetical protein
MRVPLIVVTFALLSPLCAAQLSDLQSGRNFPTAVAEFGLLRGAEADIGDVDNDGDPDVAVARGHELGAVLNELYINLGGAQAGQQGTVADETATRFAGFGAHSTTDVELVDWDGDCDLDVFFANRGSTVNGGEVSRAYVNRGGMQLGQVGFYEEATDDFWGDLVAVPAHDQIFGGDQGPFRGYSCDCDFGDLDLDGRPDLLFSSYGPNISGHLDSRVFLNDGNGRFDELWPWADVEADTKLHTLDIDLADLDGDFDLDVIASSRDSQPRLYRNDLDLATGAWSADPFTDVTREAFEDTGATMQGTNNYEVEYADMDGDGDFDLWMASYIGLADRILRNDGGLVFQRMEDWIKGDPNHDEMQIDFLDYDSDGDLDAFLPHFGGTYDTLYQSALVDGEFGLGLGLYHRTGTSSSGSLAPRPEVPDIPTGGIGYDGECVDLDGDGDPDIIEINGWGPDQSYYWENALGVPDTHAPSVHQLTDQADKSDGSDTPVIVQLRDNAGFHAIARYGVDLVYAVDGGLETRAPMTTQGGQQFQATIPGGLDGAITYRVEGRDDAGNSFFSVQRSYLQTSSGDVLLQLVGEGTPGLGGVPFLELRGAFTGGSDVDLVLCDAAPDALCLLLFSTSSTPLPFKGGLLHTVPVDAEVFLGTDAGGQLWLDATWPVGIPAGAQLWQQLAIADATAVGGASLSNAVLLTTP